MADVRIWGLRPYAESLAEMRALRGARRRGEIPDTLLLVEHPPVFTVGVQGDPTGSYPTGIPVVQVERGGHSTYHGPGQLVGYPIVDLEPRGRDVRRFVGELERLIVHALATVGVGSGPVAGQRGVWVDGQRKIASIGLAIEEWVTFHGFALNVDLDLSIFETFRPCGMDGRVMTSVSKELRRPVELAELLTPIVTAWHEAFDHPPGPTGPSEALAPTPA